MSTYANKNFDIRVCQRNGPHMCTSSTNLAQHPMIAVYKKGDKVAGSKTWCAMDESFKRSGTVPFKWEVQPGTPKHYAQPSPRTPPIKLTPPPSSSCGSFTPTRSDISMFSPFRSGRLSSASGWGCFPSASYLLSGKRKINNNKDSELEFDRGLSRWCNSPSPSSSSNRDSPTASDVRWASFGLF